MENNQPFFSICIPVWGANGKGVEYLEHNLNSIYSQTFKDFEVIVSDHSIDDVLKDYVDNWTDLLKISYFKCEVGRGLITPNINNAIRNSKGKYIKILYQDDFFYDESSLQKISSYLQKKDARWLVTGCAHSSDMETMYDPMIPKYNDNIHLGINTISCPSVLTIKNDEDTLLFNETLKFLDDVEYYKRNYDKFNLPDILPDICIINREGGVRATSMLNKEIKEKELKLMIEKYGNFR
jgi:glycosyltransferase involved in cell wall biosynthesis